MLSHPLTDFEIQKYYQNEPKSNGVFLRNSLPKRKDFKSIVTHWILFYVNNNNLIHFNSFGVEHIPKEIKKFIGNRNIRTNIYRMQAYNSIMCGHFCIGFIDFMLKVKSLLDKTKLFPSNYKIILTSVH